MTSTQDSLGFGMPPSVSGDRAIHMTPQRDAQALPARDVQPEQERREKHINKGIFSMTYDQRRQLCEFAEQHPELNQKQLIAWFHEKFNVSPSQAAISRCLKRKHDILASNKSAGSNLRRLKKVTYPLMEDALARWYMEYQDLIPIDGSMIKRQGAYFLKVGASFTALILILAELNHIDIISQNSR